MVLVAETLDSRNLSRRTITNYAGKSHAAICRRYVTSVVLLPCEKGYRYFVVFIFLGIRYFKQDKHFHTYEKLKLKLW